MRVVTRFSLGFALGLLPLVAVLAFVVSQVDRLAVTNRTIATAQFAAVNESAELIRQLDLLAEFLEKFAVSEDVRYIERVRESEQRADRAQIAHRAPRVRSHVHRLRRCRRRQSRRRPDQLHAAISDAG